MRQRADLLGEPRRIGSRLVTGVAAAGVRGRPPVARGLAGVQRPAGVRVAVGHRGQHEVRDVRAPRQPREARHASSDRWSPATTTSTGSPSRRSAAHSIRPKALGWRSSAGATARRIERGPARQLLVAGEEREPLQHVGAEAVRRWRRVVDEAARARDRSVVLVRRVDERARRRRPRSRAARSRPARRGEQQRPGLAQRGVGGQQAVGQRQVVLAEAGVWARPSRDVRHRRSPSRTSCAPTKSDQPPRGVGVPRLAEDERGVRQRPQGEAVPGGQLLVVARRSRPSRARRQQRRSRPLDQLGRRLGAPGRWSTFVPSQLPLGGNAPVSGEQSALVIVEARIGQDRHELVVGPTRRSAPRRPRCRRRARTRTRLRRSASRASMKSSVSRATRAYRSSPVAR